MKVLLRDAKVVVFDEPTAVLTPSEIIEFLKLSKLWSQQGVALFSSRIS